jgi:MFS family permease
VEEGSVDYGFSDDTISPKVYKRRFIGMVQIFCLNICTAISWIDLAPVVDQAAEHFQTSVSTINWFSTSYLFLTLTMSYPASLAARRGVKLPMLICSVLLVAGTWIMYGGSRIGSLAMALVGHSIMALAQPFAIILPAPYSALWFRLGSRATATSITSLANILGGTIGQFIINAWVKSASEVTRGILYQSILFTAVALPTILIPAKPPTPPTRLMTNDQSVSGLRNIKKVFSRPEYYLIAIPFGVLAGTFNTMSFLLYQICVPYGFTVDQCVVAGLLLVVPGLAASLVAGIVADKYRCHLVIIKSMALVSGAGLLIFIWVPTSGSVGFLYGISTLVGIGTFCPAPVAVEFVTEVIHPTRPELPIAVLWAVGQLLGGTLTVAGGYMMDSNGATPPYLYLQAGLGIACLPFTLSLGLWGRRSFAQLQRTLAERPSVSITQAVQEGTHEEAVVGTDISRQL